jgi:hypothetical protein
VVGLPKFPYGLCRGARGVSQKDLTIKLLYISRGSHPDFHSDANNHEVDAAFFPPILSQTKNEGKKQTPTGIFWVELKNGKENFDCIDFDH